ncbi:PIR protein [Plasmodium ovale]|uniref:PIR protein n=1 Tax=Plasmodium ovale TaxID=36330 RepID=A0A1C3KIE5_PLAOA|nr:PIR protein [Plasmodium ovale]
MIHFQYDNLSHLTSNKLFKYLDEHFISRGNNEECTKLQSDLKNNPEARLLCMSVTGNLENYNNLEISDLFNQHRCKYLNLWIYKRLLKFNYSDSITMKSRIFTFFYNFKKKINCRAEFFDYINEDDYKKTKSLYDYALNYKMLKSNVMQSKKRCTKEDDKYIRENIDLYKQTKDYCQRDTEHKKYCAALTDIEKVYPNELTKLECNEVVTAETLKLLEGLSTEEEACVKGQPASERQCTTRKSLENAENSFVDSQCEACICPNSSSSVAIVLPLLGSIFIFFILYKYTSLGTWIHSFLLRKKRSRIIDEEETQELLENTYDSTDINTYNGGHNINYYPLQNS